VNEQQQQQQKERKKKKREKEEKERCVPGESGSSTRQGFKTKLFKTQKLE
jgi:hypothetical protein